MAKVSFQCENCGKVVYPEYEAKKLTDGTTQYTVYGLGVSVVIVTNETNREATLKAMRAFCEEYKKKVDKTGRIPPDKGLTGKL